MPSLASVDVRLLRGSAPLKDDLDILAWLDLHDRLATAPNGRLTITQRDLALDWRRPETTVRRLLSRLAKAGWIALSTEHRSSAVCLANPPCFIRQAAAQAAISPAHAPVAVAPAKSMDEIRDELAGAFGAGAPFKPMPTAPAKPAVKAKSTVKPAENPTLLNLMAAPAQQTPPKLVEKEVPVVCAEEARFQALRTAFAEWVHEEYGTAKKTVAVRWNHWLSARCGYTRAQVENAVGIVMSMEKPPADPLSYAEGVMRNDDGEPRSRAARTSPGRIAPIPASRLVTTPEAMGVTDGLAEVSRRNAEASKLNLVFE